MKKKIVNLLIAFLMLGIIGCSNQISYSTSSVTLKQEYIKTFSPSFLIEAENITKTSLDLYNQALSNKIPEMKTFKSNYENFDKIKPINANEKDFQDCIHKFGNYYSMLALDANILKTEQDLRDRGIEGKEEYNRKMNKYNNSKEENLKHIKDDLDNIMKYFE